MTNQRRFGHAHIMVLASIQLHHVLIAIGVILLNCPVIVPAIVRSYYDKTKLGEWVRATPLLVQVLIYWAAGVALLLIGFDEREQYLKAHPPFDPFHIR